MRTATLTLLLAALLPAGAALAHDHHAGSGGMHASTVKPPVEWGARHDLARARFAILTEDRAAALVLTRDLVAVQLSDQTLRKLDREIAREKDQDEEDGLIAQVIKSAVLGSVRTLLDHSLECPIEDLRDVRYRDGRLILITEDGDRVFEDLNINDHEVLEGFSEHDALAFVREFRRAKERSR
jgi:hypothetical protein